MYQRGCPCVCLGVKGTSTGHGLSQTGWARDVLTSPHALPVHSYSSSFFFFFLLKSELHTHFHVQYAHTSVFLNLLPGCGALTHTLLSHYLFK